MFHIELREPPHSVHRFNLSERELRETVLKPWARGERIEVGERTWSAEAGAIIVLEGPEIPIGQLTMNRGWSVAQRKGRDVTERALASVREEQGASAPATALDAATDAELLADALGLELLRGLGERPMSLSSAWRLAAQRHPQMPPGESLDLARRAVASLARARLVAVARAGGDESQALQGAQLDAALAAVAPWSAESGPEALWIARA